MIPSVMMVGHEPGDGCSVAAIAMNMVTTFVPTVRTDYDDGDAEAGGDDDDS